MNIRIMATCILFVCVSACSSYQPPMPPEPQGPLFKLNVSQPHDKYQESK